MDPWTRSQCVFIRACCTLCHTAQNQSPCRAICNTRWQTHSMAPANGLTMRISQNCACLRSKRCKLLLMPKTCRHLHPMCGRRHRSAPSRPGPLMDHSELRVFTLSAQFRRTRTSLAMQFTHILSCTQVPICSMLLRCSGAASQSTRGPGCDCFSNFFSRWNHYGSCGRNTYRKVDDFFCHS